MRKMDILTLAVAGWALGCSEDDSSRGSKSALGQDAGTDAATPDSAVPSAKQMGSVDAVQLGAPCATSVDCGAGSTCADYGALGLEGPRCVAAGGECAPVTCSNATTCSVNLRSPPAVVCGL
jgi:hypothetical protein